MASSKPVGENVQSERVEHHSNLRILLVGSRNVGKSSLGNTILGREEFDTTKTTALRVKGQGKVAGRNITVVDTPGWLVPLPPELSPALLKRELTCSVCLCPPGPHCVLLVLRVDMLFGVDVVGSILQHLSLLSDDIFDHTIVLFTKGDCLGDTTIDQFIEGSEEVLQWLIEECGNRYHVISNTSSDKSQVTVLLEKIEEMIAQNNGNHYEMDGVRLQEIEEKRREQEERAKERMMKVRKQRETLRSQMGDAFHQMTIRIAILGYSRSGKSSCGNAILGRDEFDTAQRTALSVMKQGTVAGRQITVVDTPGWGAINSLEKSPELTKREILASVALCPPGPHCAILVVRLDTSFMDDFRRAAQEHVELLGEGLWQHTMVVFSSGISLGDATIEQHIETSGEDLQWLTEKSGNWYHVLNIRNHSDHGTQVSELLEKIEEMVAENGGRHFEMDPQRLNEIEERRRAEEVSAEERLMKVQTQRQTLREGLTGISLHQSELRIVLLGARNAGKSTSGNSILGKYEFDSAGNTAVCVMKQGVAAGRNVTVVDTPGWWSNFTLGESPKMTKREIMLSAGLCPPGPHAFLLVVRMDKTFTEESGGTIAEHLELLGECLWNHTIVLFTHSDSTGNSTTEQYIESEGGRLLWLVEKCNNRYHAFSNKSRERERQVTELLEKIEEMVGSNGCHFEMEGGVIQELVERKKAEEEKAKERFMMMQKKRETIQSHMDKLSQPDLRIVLLGCRRAGKSSSGNAIFGREVFDTAVRTAHCVKRQGTVKGRQVTMVDTPGWWASYTDKASPELIKRDILSSASLCLPGPNCFLLSIRVDNSFTEEHRQAVLQHLEGFGERIWKHVLVLFTSRHLLGDVPIEQYIESEGEALGMLVNKCGNRYHVLNNKSWSDGTQVEELLRKIEEMVDENGGSDYEVDKQKLQEQEERVQAEKEKGEDREVRVYKQTSTLKYVIGEPDHLSELKIVMLGFRESGKSSSGNTILGRHAFDDMLSTTQYATEQGAVARRQVTVVDTPGWSDESTGRDPVFTVSMCPPGPHAFLLTVAADRAYTEEERQVTRNQMERLGRGVWKHVIVLFTCGDSLGNTSVEQHIESSGESLQWLVERCGNRYHVFDNLSKGDTHQITQLFKKIEEVVAGNSGQCFDQDVTLGHEKPSHGDLQDQDYSIDERRGEGSVELFKKELEEMELAKSKDTPPQMGKDDRSEISSVDSSGVGTESQSSAGGSLMTSSSSGIFSMRRDGSVADGSEMAMESVEDHLEKLSLKSEEEEGEAAGADGRDRE